MMTESPFLFELFLSQDLHVLADFPWDNTGLKTLIEPLLSVLKEPSLFRDPTMTVQILQILCGLIWTWNYTAYTSVFLICLEYRSVHNTDIRDRERERGRFQEIKVITEWPVPSTKPLSDLGNPSWFSPAVFSIPTFSLWTTPPHNPFCPLGDLSLPVDRPLNIASPPVEPRRERVALQSPVQWLNTDCCEPLDSFHLISRTKTSGEWGRRQMECCGKTGSFCVWWDELPL